MVVFGAVLEGIVIQTEMGILAVAFDLQTELPLVGEEEGMELLDKEELVLNPWLQ